VDKAFIWQIGNANGGDFVVIRTEGTDAYNPYIYQLGIDSDHPLNSVSTILFNFPNASYDPEPLNVLRNAEAIFIAGGDQSEYLNYWVGTEVQTILQEKLNSNVTLGGTSAGCAVQGHWVYSAMNGSANSDVVLENPYNYTVTIAPAFIDVPFLENTITDTHFGKSIFPSLLVI
jgi:cyanophycinase